MVMPKITNKATAPRSQKSKCRQEIEVLFSITVHQIIPEELNPFIILFLPPPARCANGDISDQALFAAFLCHVNPHCIGINIHIA